MAKRRVRRPFELKKKYDEQLEKEGKNTSGNLCAKWNLTRQEFNDVLATGLLDSDGFWRGHPTYSHKKILAFSSVCKANVMILITDRNIDKSIRFNRLLPLIKEQTGYLHHPTMWISRETVSSHISRIVRAMNAYIRKKVREKLGNDVAGLRYPLLILIDSPNGQNKDNDPFCHHEMIYRFLNEIAISSSQRECLVHNSDTFEARGIEAIAKDYREACEKMKSLQGDLNRWDNSDSKKILEDENQNMMGMKKPSMLNFNFSTTIACTDRWDTQDFIDQLQNRTDLDKRLAYWILRHAILGMVNPCIVAQKLFLNDDYTFKPEYADECIPLPYAEDFEKKGIKFQMYKDETATEAAKIQMTRREVVEPVANPTAKTETKTETKTEPETEIDDDPWDDPWCVDDDDSASKSTLTPEQQMRADTISTFDLIPQFTEPIVSPPFGHVERRLLEMNLDPKKVIPYTQAEYNWNALKFENYDDMEEYYNLNAHHWHFNPTLIQWRKKALVCGLSHEEAIRRGKEMLGDDGLMLAEFCGRELEIV